MKSKIELSVFLVIIVLIGSCKKDDPTNPQDEINCIEVPTEVYADEFALIKTNCYDGATQFVWEYDDHVLYTDTASIKIMFYTEGETTLNLTIISDEDSKTYTETINVLPARLTNHSSSITTDEVWQEGLHQINGIIAIKNGATLTIEPGCVIQFTSGSGLQIGYAEEGNIIANGTENKPITFTSANQNPNRGDWLSIFLSEFSTGTFSNCIFEYGGGLYWDYSDNAMVELEKSANVSFSSCIFRNSLTNGILLDENAAFSGFSSNEIKDVNEYAIVVNCNKVHSIENTSVIQNTKGIYIENYPALTENTTFYKQTCPYFIENTIYAGSEVGNTVIVKPGVEFRFNNFSFDIGSGSSKCNFKAEGNESDKIIFTSGQETPAPGDWKGIVLGASTDVNSRLSNCIFEYGGMEETAMISIGGGAQLSIDSCILKNSSANGIFLNNTCRFHSFTHNSSENIAGYVLYLFPGSLNSIGINNSFGPNDKIYVFAGYSNDITSGTTILRNCNVPYIIEGHLDVFGDANPTLNIEAGTVLKFNPHSGIMVGISFIKGNIIAKGTIDSPITFTSSAEAGAELPGDWIGLEIGSDVGIETQFEYCNFLYGGAYGSTLLIRDSGAGNPTLSNCKIANSSGYGIVLSPGASPTLINMTYENNELGDIN